MMIRRQEEIVFESYSFMSGKDSREKRGKMVDKINIGVELYRELIFSTSYLQ